jgi:hypothetical protein
MTSKLTRAEKNAIILNESKGILHPDYYCHTTKSGKVQVRKRKTALMERLSEPKPRSGETTQQPTVQQQPIVQQQSAPVIQQPIQPPPPPEKPKENYDTVTNKQLLEKMLSILEKNSESKDKNLNSPENEKITEENKIFIENIKKNENLKEKIETPIETPKVESTTCESQPQQIALPKQSHPPIRKLRGRTVINSQNSEPVIHETINRNGRRRIL